MHGDCFLIEKDNGPVVCAERLAFGETGGRNEAWLRDTLFEHPELLPIQDIDPSFGPLIPLCKELRTEAGPLDIAFINQHGRLTLVECKLWRNPESRRKVVAQVLDYARAINQWSYSDLQRQVAVATGKKGNTPFELVKELAPNVQEHKFADQAFSAMQSGRFLLLIAGDGIREDVESMAALINRNAASGFSFGLVEVALYGLEDGGLLIQPRTLAKTQIIERTVVLVSDKANGGTLNLEDNEETASTGDNKKTVRNELGESSKQAEYREWWTPVLGTEFDDPDQEPLKLYYPNNVRTPLPMPKTWLTAYRGGGDNGQIGVHITGTPPNYSQLIEKLANQGDEILEELPEGTECRKSQNSDDYIFATGKSAASFETEEQKRQWLSETLNTYVNVFRPRIKDLM